MTRTGFWDVDGGAAARATGRWWSENAGDYLAEHGGFLGDADFRWCPEGLREEQAGLLGEVAGQRILEVGAGAMQRTAQVPVEIVLIIEALILLFLLRRILLAFVAFPLLILILLFLVLLILLAAALFLKLTLHELIVESRLVVCRVGQQGISVVGHRTLKVVRLERCVSGVVRCQGAVCRTCGPG